MGKTSFFQMSTLGNESGSTLIIALIILLVVTIVGISSINTSTTELAIARNERLHTIVFYAAEAARGYVPPKTDLYNDKEEKKFPNDPDDPDKYFPLNPDNESSFKVKVNWKEAIQAPRGSGYEASKFSAHKYEMECTGKHDSSDSEVVIRAGFYRIGF